MDTKYPIEYWEQKIPLMPLDEERKTLLIKYIKEKQPYGVSYLEIYDWIKGNKQIHQWWKSISTTTGLFDDTLLYGSFMDIFK